MKELTMQEMENVGGSAAFLVPVAIGLTVAAGAHIINNWDSFLAGLAGNKKP